MDKDRVKGTIDDAVGRAKRQAGEWTGNSQTQAEGAAQQVKGKAEKAWGNVKDAVRDAKNDAEHDRNVQAEQDRDREHVGSSHQSGRS
ncbi:MAG TPA: CsbD family protein [Terracidiphilus sp.]|nr:CsbD family protein [Terracidiphilus sp.]